MSKAAVKIKPVVAKVAVAGGGSADAIVGTVTTSGGGTVRTVNQGTATQQSAPLVPSGSMVNQYRLRIPALGITGYANGATEQDAMAAFLKTAGIGAVDGVVEVKDISKTSEAMTVAATTQSIIVSPLNVGDQLDLGDQ